MLFSEIMSNSADTKISRYQKRYNLKTAFYFSLQIRFVSTKKIKGTLFANLLFFLLQIYVFLLWIFLRKFNGFVKLF